MAVSADLASRRRDLPDALAAIELYFEQGWTDGLPIVPPTPERVRACLAESGHQPSDLIGTLPQRNIAVSAEKVAINAVMAGCKPEYFPVVAAAAEALLDDRFNAHASTASTAGAAPLVIVNGPIIGEIGLNSRDNALGNGWRANATIGRAVRLVLMNVLRAQPGVMDKATMGHPGKYSYCLAEDESSGIWQPLHVERGVEAGVSAVTLFAAEAPIYVKNDEGNRPEQIVASFVDSITRGTPRTGGYYALVVCPEHLNVFQRAGWSKADLRAAVAEQAWRTRASAIRSGWINDQVTPADETAQLRWFTSPDQIMVVAAGGRTSGTSALIPPWAGGGNSVPVTKGVGVCIDCD